MYKHILASGQDINWMAMFALVTFVLMFSISAIAIFKKNKTFIDKMASLPLEDNPTK